METNFRPWYTPEEIENLLLYANKMAKGNEIVSVETINNIYGETILRVRYNTQTEKQKKYGFFDTHMTAKLIWKLPKKYQPKYI